MMKYLCLCLCLTFVVGCGKQDVTLNIQRSALRGAGDVGITALFSQQKATAEDIAEVKKIADAILTFTDTGDLGKLTSGQVGEKVTALVSEKYRPYFSIGLNLLTDVSVDVNSFIPESLIKRFKAFVKGVQTGCVEYIIGDEPVTTAE